MGANVADFTTVRDRSFTIDASGGDEFRANVELRKQPLLDLNSILTYVVRGAEGLRLRVNINNNQVIEEQIADGDFERTIQKIFRAKNVLKRDDNEITFEALRGRGTLSDVVLWYRRNSE